MLIFIIKNMVKYYNYHLLPVIFKSSSNNKVKRNFWRSNFCFFDMTSWSGVKWKSVLNVGFYIG